jgi:hypothetical protein
MADDSPFDAEKFMQDLERSTAEHARVVAQRPGGEQLAESLGNAAQMLYDWTELMRLKACETRDVSPTQTYAWLPLHGSTAFQDRTDIASTLASFCESRDLASTHWLETNPTRNPTDWAIGYLERCFHTVADNLAGVAQLVGPSRTLRAPITLARSILEAAATGCFIIDPTVDSSERLRRALNLHMAQTKEASNERRGAVEQDECEIELAELIDFANYAGLHPAKYKSSDVLPPRIKPLDGRHDSASSIIESVLPGLGITMWRSMSAVAHSRRSQLLIYGEYSLPHKLKPWQRVESAAYHTLPGILVVRQLGDRLQQYLGWNFEPWPELWDAVATQWSVAAGMDDAQIRDRLGLPPIPQA